MILNLPTSRRLASSRSILVGLILATLSICTIRAQEPATNSAVDGLSALTSDQLITKANQDANAEKYDQTLSEVSLAIQLGANRANVYELRGSIYIEKKIWDKAERDYATADKLSPDVAYKYKLAEIKYLQKDYGNARPRFAALESDPGLGDLAAYKVFLCDMLGGHEGIAAQDLAAFSPEAKKPSYYFGTAAWDLYHSNRPEANKLLEKASKAFAQSTCEFYIASLIEAQRFRPETATFTTKDGKKFNRARISLETDGLRASTASGWTTIPLDQLPDDLSPFPDDIREEVSRKRSFIPAPTIQIPLISFTTKAGKYYDHVRWSLDGKGLSVLTPDGWTIVPLAQLPSDLSSFPSELQDALSQKRDEAGPVSSLSELVSFTTRMGKTYNQVKATPANDGLRLLTPDGWITVPFTELPDDLSCFPEELRKVLTEKRNEAGAGSSLFDAVTFTTKTGKTYQQVRVTPADEGLHVLAPEGWTIIPFNELPDDLSCFAEGLRQDLMRRRQLGDTAPKLTESISFTTRSGKFYDHVTASLTDEGLRLLTSNGWLAIPARDLPDDLSSFPDAWRSRLRSAKNESDSRTDVTLVTFTTRNGKHYNQVRASLESTGLRLTTSDGLIGVPWNQLPDDLSPFPQRWREEITTEKLDMKKSKEPSASQASH